MLGQHRFPKLFVGSRDGETCPDHFGLVFAEMGWSLAVSPPPPRPSSLQEMGPGTASPLALSVCRFNRETGKLEMSYSRFKPKSLSPLGASVLKVMAQASVLAPVEG